MKKSVGDLKAHTEIEAEYLKAKSKNTFDHPHDIVVRIRMATDVQTAYEELLSNVVDWVEKYQEVTNSEVRAAERFKEKIAQKQQQPLGVIAKSSTQFAEYQKELHQLRQTQLGFVLEYIQLPVKKVLFDMLGYKSKLDSLNRLSVEVKYWKTKPQQSRQLQDTTVTYETTMKQFKEYVDSIHRTAEHDYPKKLIAFQQSQLEFFQSASHLISANLETLAPQGLSPIMENEVLFRQPISALVMSDDTITLGKSRASSLGGDSDSGLIIRGRSGSYRNRSGSTIENVRI